MSEEIQPKGHYVHLRLTEGGPVRADLECPSPEYADEAMRTFGILDLYPERSRFRAERVTGTWTPSESLHLVELEAQAFAMSERLMRKRPANVPPFFDGLRALRYAHTAAHPVDPHLVHRRRDGINCLASCLRQHEASDEGHGKAARRA
jgi:hypothetical protein